MKSVYLFQNDLRFFNNELLLKADENSTELKFCFIVPVDYYEMSDLGFEKWSKFRKKFFLEALFSLSITLKDHGFEFSIFENKFVFKEFLIQEGIKQIFVGESPFSFENESIKNLPEFIKISREPNDLLIDKSIFIGFQKSFCSFTHFRKHIEKNEWPVTKTDLIKIKSVNNSRLAQKSSSLLQDWLLLEYEKVKSVELSYALSGTRESALEHIDNYIWAKEHLKHYKETRNGLIEFYDSSKLSAHLALGVVSPKEIYFEVLDYESKKHKNASTYWLKFELLWRDYFKYIGCFYKDLLFHPDGVLLKENKDVESSNSLKVFNDWTLGKTKQSFINANMNELRQTGFMSNRGRQNVASYLCHELKLPWIWGAKWFESQLIDYDPASNYGNWQYIAGVGPWGAHKFDYEWQAGTYDPEKLYLKKWL